MPRAPCMSLWTLIVAVVMLAAGGCGEQGGGTSSKAPGAPAQTPEEATRARVLEVLAASAQGGAALAPLTRYLGEERERRYAGAARYEGSQVRELDSIAARVRGHVALGPPTFVEAETRDRGEQAWVAWTLSFGTGEGARRVLYAFVRVGDAWLLGDIDDVG